MHVENGKVQGGKTVVRYGKKYYIPYPFNSGKFFDTIDVDKDTDRLNIRIDKAVNRADQYHPIEGNAIPYFTVADYCTQVWQGYIDSGSSLPVGIDMFEKCFSGSTGFKRPVAKSAASTASSGTKKSNVADTVAAADNDNPAKYFKDIAGHGLTMIEGFAKGAKGRESIVVPKMLKNEIVFTFVGKVLKATQCSRAWQ